MSVTAKQLSKSGAKGKDLDAIVREQLLIIDDRLQRADRTWGRNVIAHDLPTNFSFPGLEKKDAQRIIYVAIVKSLLDRGFGVRLLLEAERTVLFLEWVTDLNSDEICAMNSLICRVRIAPEEVEGFLARDRGGSARDRGGSARDRGSSGRDHGDAVRAPTEPMLAGGADLSRSEGSGGM